MLFEMNQAGKALALSSDNIGTVITESGVYKGFLKEIKFKPYKGKKYIEITFIDEETGKNAKFLNLYVENDKGETQFGCNMFYALMGLLKIQNAVPDPENDRFLNVEEKSKEFGIKIALQKESYFSTKRNEQGQTVPTEKWRMNILHFFSANTGKTYTEAIEQTEAKVIMKEIKDKQAKPRKEQNNTTNGNFTRVNNDSSSKIEPKDDLPF